MLFRSGVPQTLVVGAKDASWGPVGRAFFAHTRELGDSSARLIELPESGHFEMINPASSSWPAVYRSLAALVAELKRQASP